MSLVSADSLALAGAAARSPAVRVYGHGNASFVRSAAGTKVPLRRLLS